MKPRVFIASSVEGLGIAYCVQEGIEYDAEPTVWPQGVFNPSSFAIDDLVEVVSGSDFGIFVFTPDDIQIIRDEEKNVIRDNVVFELGLFIGHLGRKRNFIIQPRGVENLRWPTDLAGLNPVTFEPNRSDNNLKAALGPACNQIREVMKKLGPKGKTVDQVVSELDEKSLAVMANFGSVPYFSRTPSEQLGGYTFDQGVSRLRGLNCLRFEVSADGKMYAYHWTELGTAVIKKFDFTESAGSFLQASTAPVETRVSLALSDNAKALLLEAVKDQHGTILMIGTTSGFHVQTNKREFVEEGNARSEAEWKAAIDELLGHDFIEGEGRRGEVFQVTDKGYKAADALNAS